MNHFPSSFDDAKLGTKASASISWLDFFNTGFSLVLYLVLVFHYNWTPIDILYLYMVETLIFWLFTIGRMVGVKKSPKRTLSNGLGLIPTIFLFTFLICFFVGVQYIVFSGFVDKMAGVDEPLKNLDWNVALLSICLYQLVELISFYAKGNHLNTSYEKEANPALMRIFTQQFAIIIGLFAYFFFSFNQPLAFFFMLLIFLGFRLLFDTLGKKMLAKK
jgi:hypothetical protein